MRKTVPLEKSFRLLNPGPTVLVTTRFENHQNIMTAAWAMPLDFSPPKIVIVIEEDSYTRELIEKSGEFGISIPGQALVKLALQVGHVSGREKDKFTEFKISAFNGSATKAPLVEGCAGWLECKVIEDRPMAEKFDLFVGEIVGAWADDQVFSDGHWKLGPADLQTIHHAGGDTFFTASSIVRG